MFKKILRNLFRFLLFIFFIAFIAATALLGVALYLKTQDYDKLNKKYQEITSTSDQTESEEIQQYKLEIERLQKEVDNLTGENNQLNNAVVQGYGVISGSIAPVILENGDYTKFQLVCAESVKSATLKYCSTATTITKTYKLVLPAGDYKVYSFPVDTEGKSLTDGKAVYTEYVKCVLSAQENCNEDATKPAVITVGEGKTTKNIDPTDWTI